MGSHDLPHAYKEDLRAVGIQVYDFHTRKGPGNRFQINFRNHRKILVVDGKHAMAILPATHKVDLQTLKELVGAKNIAMPAENRFIDLFPDCDAGAIPPFGNLYGMELFVAGSLASDKYIAFNAGTHTEIIQMLYKDFGRLVKPKVLKFSIQK